ncbi:BLUF domain-containing protein [Flavobacterium sp.]|uniref:BLUF domain-containing protein n=1 Tax=Flavobacterium sp. TaxID=239 RepID=UPI00286CABC5|nr:BLUF domain-containing protein [Flavobacterium sp.]
MYKIIYFSSATKLLDEVEINSLLVKAHHYNFEKGITGVLLYLEGDFLQVLEGKKADVVILFDKIKKDSRHQLIITIFEQKISKRQFPDWTMGFHSSTYEKLRRIKGLETIEKRNLVNINDKSVLTFLNKFIKSHKEAISFW